ncbi:nitrogenase component 1, partial [Methanoculleus chikugoensis]|uniref:nitrogenase component 1 n=1 Tax=Methanoculleus chikugoensis TaxID=118126 RepID=UPI001FB2C84C
RPLRRDPPGGAVHHRGEPGSRERRRDVARLASRPRCGPRNLQTASRSIDGVDPPRPVMDEVAWADARIRKACEKYLRRFDPPPRGDRRGEAYASFAADLLDRYLGAEIACVAARNGSSGNGVTHTTDFSVIREMILDAEPDLILGSSYEAAIAPGAAFVGLTLPLRDRVALSSPRGRRCGRGGAPADGRGAQRLHQPEPGRPRRSLRALPVRSRTCHKIFINRRIPGSRFVRRAGRYEGGYGMTHHGGYAPTTCFSGRCMSSSTRMRCGS